MKTETKKAANMTSAELKALAEDTYKKCVGKFNIYLVNFCIG